MIDVNVNPAVNYIDVNVTTDESSIDVIVETTSVNIDVSVDPSIYALPDPTLELRVETLEDHDHQHDIDGGIIM